MYIYAHIRIYSEYTHTKHTGNLHELISKACMIPPKKQISRKKTETSKKKNVNKKNRCLKKNLQGLNVQSLHTNAIFRLRNALFEGQNCFGCEIRVGLLIF